MFKSKSSMEKHKRKQSQMNPSASHKFQTQSKSFRTHLQTTHQAINNTSHPSSSHPSSSHPSSAAVRPSFPYNMLKNSLPPSSLHQQTADEANDHINHLPSSFFQPTIRPSFLYHMRQNSSSSSSSLQASSSSLQASSSSSLHASSFSLQTSSVSLPPIIPSNVHYNSSSSASSSHSESLQSQPPTVHNQDLFPTAEIDQAYQYQLNLLSEVEIIDKNGKILRTQKMSVKDVYKLKGGEKVLVPVNELYRPTKNVAGLCARFMTLLLNEPNLCPPDANYWKDCKEECGAMLIAELRRRFSIPQGETIDKVLSAMFSKKRRSVNHRLKMSLYEQAANKLNVVNGIDGLDAQETNYTENELLEALDLLEPPENFSDQQWRNYKSNPRKPLAKKLSLCGKKARSDQLHTQTTGAVSFARIKDKFKLKNKRSPNDVESFHLCYKTTDGTYIQEATREMMVIANQEISSKTKELGSNPDPDLVANIAREVLNELLGNQEPHCFGAGVTKSQISKFSRDLRRMRGEELSNENRFLSKKVETQSKEIETQKREIETQKREIETYKKEVETQKKQVHTQGLQIKDMGKRLNELYGMFKVVQIAFPDLYNDASTSGVAGSCDKQPSGASPVMDHYSPVIMDHYSPVMDHYSPAMDHYPDNGMNAQVTAQGMITQIMERIHKRITQTMELDEEERSVIVEEERSVEAVMKTMQSPKKKLLDSFLDKPIWNLTDSEQLSAVKEVLHVSKAQSVIVCREDEQKRIVEFSKQCLEQGKAGSLYICGYPGTGKSLSMENVKGSLAVWAKETGGELQDILSINCTSLSTTSEIFNKSQPNKKSSGRSTPLRQLQQLYSQKQQSSDTKMMFVIADELDYLITKDRVVLHDLFMLTTLPFSKIILIGIANAIDLADRSLPKLQSLNCKPMVVSFRAYSMDQIIMILKQRLIQALPYTVFQPQALELCARKVSAASGDMRKALGICRGALSCLKLSLEKMPVLQI